jgi:hypothetical protein
LAFRPSPQGSSCWFGVLAPVGALIGGLRAARDRCCYDEFVLKNPPNTDFFHDALAFFLIPIPLFIRLVPFLWSRHGR